jgi:hypothetical protein
MTHLHAEDRQFDLKTMRRQARAAGHVQRAQLMLLAAGLAAFGIVAVAGTMMTTLL